MKPEFFIQNRTRSLEFLGDEMLVLTAYDTMQQTNDGAAPFVQESNFWWLTGIEQSGWRLVLDGTTNEAALVPPKLSKTDMLFDSYLTPEQAVRQSGIDVIITEDDLLSRAKGRVVHTLIPIADDVYSFTLNPAPKRLYEMVRSITAEIKDAQLPLAKLRAIKQPAEIEAIEQAIDMTIGAFTRVAANLSSFKTEAEIAAEFTYDFMKQVATHAYEPIVASGKNACTLHYVANTAPLRDGLVLLDVGAKKNGYSADITRTYRYGSATARQVDVHEAVKDAEAKIIATLKPGLAVKDYLEQVDDIMKSALASLNLLEDRDDEAAYRRYFPHAISHGLGVDVHDSLGRAKQLEPGMILTVEPGIYIPEENIGVRIEDNILITDDGIKNLSGALPTML